MEEGRLGLPERAEPRRRAACGEGNFGEMLSTNDEFAHVT